MSTGATSLFEPDGPNRCIPTELARGPWDPRACHGGPVSALLTRAIEQTAGDSPVDWQIARLSIELTRPVPVGVGLTLDSEIERDGQAEAVAAVSSRSSASSKPIRSAGTTVVPWCSN